MGHRTSECVLVFNFWGLGGGCLKYMWFFSCVVLVVVSQESRFGRRASKRVVVFRVGGLGGGF